MSKRGIRRFSPYPLQRKVQSESRAEWNAFTDLPPELMFRLFVEIRLEDLCALAQTSTKLRDWVLAFVVSSDFGRKLANLLSESAPSSMKTIFRRIGFLLKRATCLLPTSKRLKIAQRFYALHGPSDLVSRKALAGCWGALIKAFVGGWEFNECERVFKTVCNFGTRDEVNTLLNQFLASEPGSNRENEKRLRIFFRSLFLDPNWDHLADQPDDEYFGYYLGQILREHSTYYQAKLIYLLFGPANKEGDLQWHVMFSQNIRHADVYGKMGNALCALLYAGSEDKRNVSLSVPQLISLVEEVTSFPDNWTLYNFAALLDHCEESILTMILSSRVINGRMKETCEIFACLTLISAQEASPMSYRMRQFIKVLQSVKKKSDQMSLIAELAKTQYRRLSQLISGNLPAVGIEAELSAIELFNREALRMAFGNISSSPEL